MFTVAVTFGNRQRRHHSKTDRVSFFFFFALCVCISVFISSELSQCSFCFPSDPWHCSLFVTFVVVLIISLYVGNNVLRGQQ